MAKSERERGVMLRSGVKCKTGMQADFGRCAGLLDAELRNGGARKVNILKLQSGQKNERLVGKQDYA